MRPISAFVVVLGLAELPAGAGADPVRHVADASTDGPLDYCQGRGSTWGKTNDGWWGAKGFPHGLIVRIANAGCPKGGRFSYGVREEVAAAYSELARWSGLPAEELRTYLAANVDDDHDPFKAACESITTTDPASLGLVKLLACEATGDRTVMEDDPSSALASAGAVYDCLWESDGIDMSDLSFGKYAVCGAEARTLDRAALEKELDARNLSPVLRTRVRISMRQLDGMIATLDARLKKLIAKDPPIEEFFYTVPDRTWAKARSPSADAVADLAAVRAYEQRIASVKRPAVAGCFGELRPRFADYVKRAKPATLDDARKALVKPVGYQLARALQSCASYDERLVVAVALEGELSGARQFRGPRSVVYWALHGALDNAGDTMSKLALEQDQYPYPADPKRGNLDATGGIVRRFEAKIAKLERKSERVHLEFATVAKKDVEYDCRETSKVERVTKDGQVIYRQACGDAKTITIRTTEEPADLDAEHGAALAKGRHVSIVCDERTCLPYAVWSASDKKKLLAFLGMEL